MYTLAALLAATLLLAFLATMSLESKAFFRAKALQFGITEASIEKLAERGWDTMGSMAFSCTQMP